MPTPPQKTNPAATPSDELAAAQAQLRNCQAAQALTDADMQAAIQDLHDALQQGPRVLSLNLNQAIDSVLAYGQWANHTEDAFFAADEAWAAAEQAYAVLANAASVISSTRSFELQLADHARIDAREVREARALERQLANEELEDATAYLNRFQRDGKAVLDDEIEDLRTVWQIAVNVFLEARQETQEALERVQALSEAGHTGSPGVPFDDPAFDAAAQPPFTEALPDKEEDGGDAPLLPDCFAVVVGSLPDVNFGSGHYAAM